jgi:hypothetical protein
VAAGDARMHASALATLTGARPAPG